MFHGFSWRISELDDAKHKRATWKYGDNVLGVQGYSPKATSRQGVNRQTSDHVLKAKLLLCWTDLETFLWGGPGTIFPDKRSVADKPLYPGPFF